jgi:hypothetical protein
MKSSRIPRHSAGGGIPPEPFPFETKDTFLEKLISFESPVPNSLEWPGTQADSSMKRMHETHAHRFLSVCTHSGAIRVAA